MDKKGYIMVFFVGAILLLMLIGIFSSCTVELPAWKLPSRTCGATTLGKFMCSDKSISVQECKVKCSDDITAVVDCAPENVVYYWDDIENCAEKTSATATAVICDYYIGLFANTQRPICVDGCYYMGNGVKLWERGCFNGTTFGECRPTGVKILDCSIKGCSCYNGYGGTCVGAAEFKAVSSEVQATYEQDIDSSLGGNSLNEANLPYTLSRGRFIDWLGDNKNDVEYSQSVQFTTGNGKLTSGKLDGSDAGTDYLFFDAGVPLYAYTMSLDNPVIFSTADARSDLLGTTLVMMGRNFTIKDTDESLSSYMTLSDGSSTYKLNNNGAVALVVADGTEEEIPGSYVEFVGTSSEGLSSGEAIRITYTPAEAVYVPVGGSFVDPIFRNLQVNLDSVETVDGQATGSVSFGSKALPLTPTVCEEPEAAPASAAPAASPGNGGSPGSSGGSVIGGGSNAGAVFGGSITSRLRVAESAGLDESQTAQEPLAEPKNAETLPKPVSSELKSAAKNSNLWIAAIAVLVIIAIAVIVYVMKKKAI